MAEATDDSVEQEPATNDTDAVVAQGADDAVDTSATVDSSRNHTAPIIEPTTWVGIGASAGGLEALRGFARNLRNDLPVTYVVAQHMAPNHRSMLVEIIARDTELPVQDVVDGLEPRANVIYITPPNRNCTVKDGRLRLSTPPVGGHAPKPSVDLLFETLAEDRGDSAIGIVFSGTGSDGAMGVQAIHDHDGIVVAQDEATAKYDSMPVSALKTGSVDLVMSPEEVGARMPQLIAQPRNLEPLQASPVHLDNVSELVELLRKQTDVDFRHYKSPTFQRRVQRRMTASGMTDLDTYVELARTSPQEINALYLDLLISVTSFFRDAEEFEAMASHVQRIVTEKSGEPIRVWVAGSATGEEAYSLAILFAEAMGGPDALADMPLQIFATDLDERAIELGRRAFYEDAALLDIPAKHIDEYFETAPKGYLVKKALRDKVVFSLHNVASDPPFLNIDLVSCRNLMIYFEPVLQAHVLSLFHYSLRDRGTLFMGKSETVSAAEALFRSAGADRRIYRQKPTGEGSRQQFSMQSGPTPTTRLLRRARTQLGSRGEAKPSQVYKDRFEALVKSLGPNAILVDDNLKIIQVFGNITDYVQISAGPMTSDASSMLAPPFDQDVRILVPAALRKEKSTAGMTRESAADPQRRDRMKVYPIDGVAGAVEGGDGEGLALVTFESWTEEVVDETEDGITSDESARTILRLQRELAISQASLQQTVEVVETSNEELQALNEEMQSTNEELQSTNEELETSNEELSSTNEELTTVNDELEVNTNQLSVANQDMQSILDHVGVPLIVVDTDLEITHTSAKAQELIDMPTGEGMFHLSKCVPPEGFPELVPIARDALRSGEPVEVETETVSANNRVTAVPHFYGGGEIRGAIILVEDYTEALQDSQTLVAALAESNTLLDAAAHVAGVGYVWADLESGQRRWSSQLYKILGVEESFVPSADNEWGAAVLGTELDAVRQTLLRQVVEEGNEAEITVPVTTADGMARTIQAHFIPTKNPAGKVVGWIGVVSNVTDHHQALDTVARAAGIGYTWADLEADQLTWSDGMYDVMGLDPATYMPPSPSSLVAGDFVFLLPEFHQRFVDGFAQVCAGESFVIEVEMDTTGPKAKTVRWSFTPTFNDNGEVTGWFSVTVPLVTQPSAAPVLDLSEPVDVGDSTNNPTGDLATESDTERPATS